MKIDKILATVAMVFIFSHSIAAAQVSYRTGIALQKSLAATYQHKAEIIEIGEIFLSEEKLFSSSVSRTEWAFLKRHLLNYLRIHDDPKTWEKERLIDHGYPPDLPTVKAFLASSHGTSFHELPEGNIAHKVKAALNGTEKRYKDLWARSQKINDGSFKILMFWEHFLDILATRLSSERAQELNLHMYFIAEPNGSCKCMQPITLTR
ncbi:MAG: hypothetical protein IPK68_10435 [Bdellovibrionales bacterium]|nr:hypothetical protein [Bdellovibrionales bacterium]